jgi:hypothetical protein
MSRGTFRVNDFTGWSKALTVTADGGAVISHAGAARVAADRRPSRPDRSPVEPGA